MLKNLLAYSLAFSVLAIGATTARGQAPITMPVEVVGANGTQKSVSFTLPANVQPSSAGTLWLQIHGLSYENKASIQINSSPWIALNAATVQLEGRGASYGGMGGAFATLQLHLPLTPNAIHPGVNTLQFRFNQTDGFSIGFRVVAFNLKNAQGTSLLPASQFVNENPNTWTPPLNTKADIAAGKSLFQNAVLKQSSFKSAPKILATCSDCHTQDGRDLKYFNFSNNSIIARSQFHGLTANQGSQIASYIRSLSVPNPGRPWNPPYQPGPGLDSQPIANWSAGAGISAVLDNDATMVSYIFPQGIKTSAVATSGLLNLREMPLALQLPDWNHWLPQIHPKDAWGTEFINSSLFKIYAGQGGNSYPTNLRSQLASWQAGKQSMAAIQSLMSGWDMFRETFLNPRDQGNQGIVWTPEYSQKVYSTAQWQMIKLWEMMQEFNLEPQGVKLFKNPDARTWFAGTPFSVSPHSLDIPDGETGIGGSAVTNKYFSNGWYQLQLILDSGNRENADHNPVDWGYAYNNVKDLYNYSGSPEIMRAVAMVVKGMQERDNGIGPEDAQRGWNPGNQADVSHLVNDSFAPMWQETTPSVRAAVMEAVLTTWFAKCQQYTPHEYYLGGQANANDIPVPNTQTRSWVGQMWFMIPRFRAAGVNPVLLDNMCAWAKTIWPKGKWETLKSQ